LPVQLKKVRVIPEERTDKEKEDEPLIITPSMKKIALSTEPSAELDERTKKLQQAAAEKEKEMEKKRMERAAEAELAKKLKEAQKLEQAEDKPADSPETPIPAHAPFSVQLRKVGLKDVAQ
jgi:hypothetical protein